MKDDQMNTMSVGKVSICVPTYNRPHLISQLIDSIFAQSYQDYEIIITDNSDNTETQELIEKRYQDYRVSYHKNENNLGMDGNTLRALSFVTGKFFTFTPDDDIWIDSEKLEKQVRLLCKFPAITCCFSNVLHVNYDGSKHDYQFKSKIIVSESCEIVGSSSLLLTNSNRYFVNILTAVIRVELLSLFKESWKFGSEEYFMWYLGGIGQDIGFCYDAMVAHRDGDHCWEIADGKGSLVNYRNNAERRSKQMVEIYSNLIKLHKEQLKCFNIETEKVIFTILIGLIGFQAFKYKGSFSRMSVLAFAWLYIYSLIRASGKFLRRIVFAHK